MSLRAIVKAYIKNNRPNTLEELNWYREQPDLRSAIEYAALAINRKGKRHHHQCRLQNTTLQQARNIHLANMDAIEQTKDFDQLIGLFDVILGPVHRIGELYIYDTALRIGAKANLLPKQVYLHAGTRDGAKALGISKKAKVVEPASLPAEFKELEPYGIEDVLCIYKDILKKEQI